MSFRGAGKAREPGIQEHRLGTTWIEAGVHGFRACPSGIPERQWGEEMKRGYWFSAMALVLLLMAAGCTDSGAASDNDKRGVFYGGVSTGGTLP